MLDYYTLTSEAKSSLLRQWQQIDAEADPLVWAWIVHSFSVEGLTNNPFLEQALEQSRPWLESDRAWCLDSNLGAIGLLCAVLVRTGEPAPDSFATKIGERIDQMRKRDLGKFSRLNDPDFVFGVASGLASRPPDELTKWLREHCEHSMQCENWRRRVLFAAAADELGAGVHPFPVDARDLSVYDLFPVIWFAARYASVARDDGLLTALWQAFERVKEGISLELTSLDKDSLYPASPIDAAMLYEALLLQTQEVNPVTLFNNLPWHPAVRQAAESLFVSREYVMAVFQAAVTFIDAVKSSTGYPTDKNGKQLDGVVLMVAAFDGNSPLLKFNNLQCPSDHNEQRGLALMAEGIVSAVRNPKGHVPKGAITLTPYEALEQLGIISYLMRRLDRAHR